MARYGDFYGKIDWNKQDMGEAREAEKFNLKYFIGGAVVLSIGILLLSYSSNMRYHCHLSLISKIDSSECKT